MNQPTPRMKPLNKILIIAVLFSLCSLQSFSQSAADDGLPKDYLTKEFHAGRRDALRAMMPANSVAVIFAYP